MGSQESDFNEHSLNLRSWILKRGYPEKIINAEMSKVKFNVDNKRSSNRQKKEISFTQKFKVLQNIINTYLYLLCMNNEVKGSVHLKLWFHLGVPAKSVVI